jgi:hypothetical protein
VQMCAVGWFDEALATLIAYDGYFRVVSELLPLRVKDFHYTNSSNTKYTCRLRFTKTGSNKLVTFTKQELGAALVSFIRTRHLSSTDRIFSFSAARYRHCFRMSCEMMGWKSVHFVPHSLRHGHASHGLRVTTSLLVYQLRQSWSGAGGSPLSPPGITFSSVESISFEDDSQTFYQYSRIIPLITYWSCYNTLTSNTQRYRSNTLAITIVMNLSIHSSLRTACVDVGCMSDRTNHDHNDGHVLLHHSSFQHNNQSTVFIHSFTHSFIHSLK